MSRKPHKGLQATTKKIKKADLSEYISLDLIPDPFVILYPDCKIYDINSNCLNLIGKEKKYLIGKDFRNIELFEKLEDRVSQSIISKKEDFDRIVYNNRHLEVYIHPFKRRGKLDLICIIFKDITNFVHLENELLKRNKELIIISTLSSAFISSDNIDHVVEDLLEKILLITDFSIGWLLIKENQMFKLKTSKGISSEIRKKIEEGALESICYDSINTGEPIYIIESFEKSRVDLFRKEGIAFLTAIPLVSEKNPIGILFLASRIRRVQNFDFDLAALLTLVANNVTLILDKIKLFQETKRLSVTDGLTGLYNRRYFYKNLDVEIARSKRYGNTFSLMLFDIDNFKNINDTYGHQAGDEVLMELAKILKLVSRETDIIVRYGGEEIIIILPNTSEEETITLANRIKNTVEQTTFIINESTGVTITLSGGIASYPENAPDAKSLLHAADTALYSAKASGKNKISCYKDTINEENI